MNLAEITVTEAGFGSDLGAEKFLDIVCDCAKFEPNAIVLVASIRSLKMHGGLSKEQLNSENINALKNGISNLNQHIKNLYAFNKPIVVAINEFDNDSRNEKQILEQYLQTTGLPYSFTKAFVQGSKGSIDLAKKILKAMTKKTKLKPVYTLKTPLFDKIQTLVKQCYGAIRADFSPIAKQKLEELKNKHAYICMAKTPLTFSDDPKEIVINQPFTITIRDVIVANGANFIILLAGEIFRMPGLPKVPAACKM
jgi:formate--tetrahydrofolate ligase